jgi:thiol-disulfide isomerase/thioredoxin
MKYLIGLVAMLLPLLSGAQAPPVKALNIGDTLPLMPQSAIINYHKPTAALSDFNNGLVILDFWSTWCIPCIKAMPRFEALQQKFKDRLQFVLSTFQEKEKIEKFLQIRKVSLPCFVEDKELPQYFPHNSVPHEVWIKEGRVLAITYAEEVTAENIQRALDGEKINLVEKKANFDYNISQPLLVSGNGGDANDLLYHSVITSYLDGISGAGGVMTDSLNRYKIRVIDGSVARLYATAASQYNPDFTLPNRTIIEASGPETINPSSNPQYTPEVRKYFYSYELALPAAAKAGAGRLMMEDLNRYFGIVYHIHGLIEDRKVLCRVLRKEDGPLLIETRNGTAAVEEKDGYELWINQPFQSFFYALAFLNRKQPLPFVNKTGITGNVDAELPLGLSDAALQSFLKKYRLRLSTEECVLPMLVIKNLH